MRLCFVTPRFPPNVAGGGEISAYLLVESLLKYYSYEFDDIDVVTFDADKESSKITFVNELEKYNIGKKICIIRNSSKLSHKYKEPLNYFAYGVLKNLIKKKKYDIVHTYNMDLLPAVGKIAKDFNLKCVANLNGVTFSSTVGDWYLEKALTPDLTKVLKYLYIKIRNKYLNKYSSKIKNFIVLNKFYEEIFLSEGFRGRYYHINNMYDHKLIDQSIKRENKNDHNKFRILYLNTYTLDKGIDIVIRAFSRFAEYHKDVELLIAGDKKSKLIELIRRLDIFKIYQKVSKKIKVLNTISRSEIKNFLRNGDVLLQPYRYPFPVGRVIIESLLFELPVITTGNDIYSPIIKNMKNGMLVYPPNESKIVEYLDLIYSDTKLRKKLGKNGRKSVIKLCNPKIIAKQYLEVYKSL